MFSIERSFFICILFAVGSDVFAVTKEEVCEEPTINGGLSVVDPTNTTKIDRFLFWKNFVMPYEWERRQVVWQKIVPIKDMFKGGPDTNNNLIFGLVVGQKAYLSFEKNKILVYKSDDKHWNYESDKQLSDMPVDYLKWTIETNNTSKQNKKDMYFLDASVADPMDLNSSNPKGSKDVTLDYALGKIAMTVSDTLDTSKVTFPPEIFPNTFLFENKYKNVFKIPAEFDGYYQTPNRENVFFRKQSACLTSIEVEPGKQSEYCHTFIDVRTLIGCTTADIPISGSEPEVRPGEPQDIDPDF